MTKVEIEKELTRINSVLDYIEMKDYWSTADRDRARDLSSRKEALLLEYALKTVGTDGKGM